MYNNKTIKTMSKIVDILSKAIAEASTGVLFEDDVRKMIKELDECPVKVYREDKTQPLPVYSKEGDACMDIYAISIEYDEKKDRYIVHTGLHFELPDDYEMELRPRSSNTKTEWYIPNAPGTLDCGYRGEMLVIFKCRDNIKFIDTIDSIGSVVGKLVKEETEEYNDMVDCSMYFKDAKEQLEFPYKVGDRICQLLIRRRERIVWKEVESLDELSKTERGSGGFGHTGK